MGQVALLRKPAISLKRGKTGPILLFHRAEYNIKHVKVFTIKIIYRNGL